MMLIPASLRIGGIGNTRKALELSAYFEMHDYLFSILAFHSASDKIWGSIFISSAYVSYRNKFGMYEISNNSSYYHGNIGNLLYKSVNQSGLGYEMALSGCMCIL